jgi:hypothetical protein
MNVRIVCPMPVLTAALLSVAGFPFSVFAQRSASELPPGATVQFNTNLVVAAPVAIEPAPEVAAETAAPAPVNVADLVDASAPVIVETASGVPAVVVGYLPSQDTNASIGITYPSGSSDFVYLFSGNPRAGDPRLPATAAAAATVVPVLGPPVTYEVAEPGSGSVLVRKTDSDVIREFPPGAFLRGSSIVASTGSVASPSASLSPTGGLIAYPGAALSATRGDFVQNFPPGARLRRSSAASVPQ